MSIPKRVKVCGVMYDVRQVSGRVLGDALGDCLPVQTRIRIDRSLSDEAKRSVLRHEIGHAVFHESISGYLTMVLHKSEAMEHLEEMLVRSWLPDYLTAIKDAKL